VRLRDFLRVGSRIVIPNLRPRCRWCRFFLIPHLDSTRVDIVIRVILMWPLRVAPYSFSLCSLGSEGFLKFIWKCHNLSHFFKSWYKTTITFYYVWIGFGTGLRTVPRDRPPILIVYDNPGSTTWFGHARLQKPSMRVGCTVCVLQPLTADHDPTPVTSLLHARMFPRLLYWQVLQGRNSQYPTSFHHETSHNGVTTLRQCVSKSAGVG